MQPQPLLLKIFLLFCCFQQFVSVKFCFLKLNRKKHFCCYYYFPLSNDVNPIMNSNVKHKHLFIMFCLLCMSINTNTKKGTESSDTARGCILIDSVLDSQRLILCTRHKQVYSKELSSMRQTICIHLVQ